MKICKLPTSKYLAMGMFLLAMSPVSLHAEEVAVRDMTEEVQQVLMTYDTTVTNYNSLLTKLTTNNYNIVQIEKTAIQNNLEQLLSTTETAQSIYESMGVPMIADNLEVYKEANTESTVVGILFNGSVVEILNEGKVWYKIKSGTVEGYVKKEYIATDFEMEAYIKENPDDFKQIATVKANTLRVRSECDTENQDNIITSLTYNDTVEVLGHNEDEEWVQVSVDGNEGYVYKDYVDVEIQFKESEDLELKRKQEEEKQRKQQELEDKRDAVVAYAKQYVGLKYVWGGTSLSSGVDCSGFVQQIYRHFGYSLSRTSRSQAFDGTEVSLDSLEKGDLLFYIKEETNQIGHVSMYIGNNQVIHASTPETGVRISNLNYRTPCKAIRIIH